MNKKQIKFKISKKLIVIVSIISFIAVFTIAGLMQNDLTLTTYDITSPFVEKHFDGYKIVHISDYHSGLYNGTAEDIITMTAKQKPNIICLTGDIVDGDTIDFSSVETLIEGLVDIAPVYAVLGNNELKNNTITDNTKDIYQKYGVQLIERKKITIYDGDGVITILGIADTGDKTPIANSIVGLKENYKDEGFGIILYHRANEFEAITDMGYQLVLSGHLHGGLIRIPAIGGILSPYGEIFPKYSGGLYEKNGVYLVSNRGIGNNTRIPRMYNPPEVVAIILHTKG